MGWTGDVPKTHKKMHIVLICSAVRFDKIFRHYTIRACIVGPFAFRLARHSFMGVGEFRGSAEWHQSLVDGRMTANSGRKQSQGVHMGRSQIGSHIQQSMIFFPVEEDI